MAVFKHHTAPITSVEWHPTDASVFVACGADGQATLWDLAVERDDASEGTGRHLDVPPQLLFIHMVCYSTCTVPPSTCFCGQFWVIMLWAFFCSPCKTFGGRYWLGIGWKFDFDQSIAVIHEIGYVVRQLQFVIHIIRTHTIFLILSGEGMHGRTVGEGWGGGGGNG